MSIREFSRLTGLAQNTVKKYLRSDEVEPKHAGHTRSSKLDPYVEKLTLWLGMEVTKSRCNLKQLHTAPSANAKEEVAYDRQRARHHASSFGFNPICRNNRLPSGLVW